MTRLPETAGDGRGGPANLDRIKRFDMPGFQPRPDYVREMRRFGILRPEHRAEAPIDVYATEHRYWGVALVPEALIPERIRERKVKANSR